MSTTDLAVRDVSASLPLASPRLPRWAPVLMGVLAVAAAGLPALLLGWGVVAWLLLALVLFLVALPAWSLVVENRRAAVDRLMTVAGVDGVRGGGAAAGLAGLDGGQQRRRA